MAAILSTVENACSLLVQDRIVSSSLSIPLANVYTGIDNETKALPEVICWAEAGERLADLSAATQIDWWKVKTNIIVAHRAARADRNVATNDANTIFDSFCDISASLSLTNITSSFTCGDVLEQKMSTTFEQNSWVQMLEFTMLMCPSD